MVRLAFGAHNDAAAFRTMIRELELARAGVFDHLHDLGDDVTATLDLALYLAFFIPGILGLMYAGFDYALDSWRIREHSNVTSEGPPVYQFKAIIPVAGTLVMLQGLAEIMRCVVCLKTGKWPERLKDAEEIDVVEQQLATSAYVDEESRERAIQHVHDIDEAARQRGLGGEKDVKL